MRITKSRKSTLLCDNTTNEIVLDSINDLTNLGFKIMRCFVLIILFLTAVSIAVSAVFFRSFGTGGMSFAPQQLIQMILDIIPTNLIETFLENNTTQLVILGFLLGSALLLLGVLAKSQAGHQNRIYNRLNSSAHEESI